MNDHHRAGKLPLRGRARKWTAALAALLTGATAVVALPPMTVAAAQTPASCPTPLSLTNGDFEFPVVTAGAGMNQPDSTAGIGWKTTATDHLIEFWRNGGNVTGANGGVAISAQNGSQWVELNATQASTLYQVLPTTPGQVMHWSLWHRARYVGIANGQDVMQVRIAGTVAGLTSSAAQVPTGQAGTNISDGPNGWVRYSGTYTVPAGQVSTAFGFTAVSSASGNATLGNFLDNITFGNAPCVLVNKSVNNLNAASGSLNRPGDTLQYSMTLTNNGGDVANGVVLTDAIPAGTSYVPGSLTVGGTAVTDAADSDAGEVGGGQLTARAGTGATGTVGGNLAVGATTTVTFKVTVNGNAPAGTIIPNTATAAYNWSGQPIPNSTSNTTSTRVDTTGVTLAKSIGGTTDSNTDGKVNAGDKINYAFLITNTGSVPLSSVVVNDAKVGTVSCPSQTLAAGASMTCTASYTVQPADMDAGKVTNTATVTATPPGNAAAITSAPSSANQPLTSTPRLTVVKTANPGTVSGPGQVVTYSFVVTNTGDVTVNGLSIADTFTAPAGPAPAISCPTTTLAPKAATTCTASYTTTKADADNGQVRNTATVSGTPVTGGSVTSTPSTATVAVTQSPALTITKTPSVQSVSAAGQSVGYSFLVTNSGNVTLTGIAVADTMTAPAGPNPAVTCPQTSLAAGASMTCTTSYLVTQADLDAGRIRNTATATGTGPGGGTITSPPATATVQAPAVPKLTLTKTATPTTVDTVGQAISYTFTITNTGNVTVKALTVTDTFTAPGGPVPTISCPKTVLAPGESTSCTAAYNASAADLNAGKIVNSATAQGSAPDGTAVASPASTATVTVNQAPGISVVKAATPTTVTAAGQQVSYTFTVTNTGNVSLTGVGVTDTLAAPSGPALTINCPASTLIAGGQMVCTATYTVIPADLDAGSISNTATASGTPPTGPARTSAPSTATVTAQQNPALDLTKTATTTDFSGPGQTIGYTFKVTNTGNVTLTDLTVTDVFTRPAGHSIPVSCVATTLPAGGSTTCSASYTTTQADVDAGGIDNTASAAATAPDGSRQPSAPATATVGAVRQPGLTLLKQADTTSVDAPGQHIAYTFTVTNTGNVTVSSVAVTDTVAPPGGPSPLVSCPSTSLAPGASIVCTATYTTVQADITAGTISNTAVATATDPAASRVTSDPSTVVVAADQRPSLSLVKTPTPTTVTAAGTQITYSFEVTNTGNVPIVALSVTDAMTAPAGPSPAVGCPPGQLAPGATVTCTATYTATQADIDNGIIKNSATATGQDLSGNPVTSGRATASVSVVSAPSLALVKTADRSTVTAAGQLVHYSFTVTNTGNVTASGLAVVDAFTAPGGPVPPVICSVTSLAPGASTVCTSDYPATQADLDNGSITNTAVATAKDPQGTSISSDPSTVTVGAPSAPGLQVNKSVSPATVGAVGDQLHYTFAVHNSGNVSLSLLHVQDTLTAPAAPEVTVSCPTTTIAPGQDVVCTGSYTVTQADLDNGSIGNSAVATARTPDGVDVTSPPSEATASVTQRPSLSVVKSANPTTVSTAGQHVGYSFAVTNTGNVTMSGISITDTLTAPAGPALTVDCPVTTLAPGAGTVCTATYVATQNDLDNGSINNSATAGGISPKGVAVSSDPSTATVAVTPSPGLTVVKSSDATSITAAGQTVHYSFLVHNTGNLTVSALSVTDVVTAPGGPAPAVTCPVTSLAPDATTTCTGSYAVTQADMDNGKVSDIATATGTVPGGGTITSGPSTVTIPAAPDPGMSLVKSADPTTVSAVGEQVDYTFAVRNTGNVTVKALSINDTMHSPAGAVSQITCDLNTLAPGESTQCHGSYLTTQADLDNGSISNSAAATATDPGGQPVSSAVSTAVVTATQQASLQLSKTATPGTVSKAGDQVTYRFVVTNTGNVTVTALTIDDQLQPPAGPAVPVNCPVTTLSPGATTTCTAVYPASQADVDHGRIDNTATAAAKDPGGQPVSSGGSTAVVTIAPQPAITILKKATPTFVSALDDVISYTFLVRNTGNVTVSGIVVTDQQAAPAAPDPVVSCPADALPPSTEMACTATYSASQADLNNGSITDTATATGNAPDGTAVPPASSSATVEVHRLPALSVVKSADPTTVTAAGQSVGYTFVVTNTGNQSVHGIAVVDTMTAPAGPSPTVTCPVTTLDPGKQTTCTASYVVSQSDIDQGEIANTARATGLDPTDTAVQSPIATATVGVNQQPALQLTKNAIPTSATTAGTSIHYTFLVENTGNVTIGNLSIADVLSTPAGPPLGISCPDTTLAPNASTTCTGDYLITQQDVDHGSVDNTAVAKGSDPSGHQVSSLQSRASVTIAAQPSLVVTKHADRTVVNAPGQVITYSFLVANDGNVTVTGIGVNDPLISQISCPATVLAPSGTMNCTGTYTVTQHDIDTGSVTNTANATGADPNGRPVTSPDSSAVVTADRTAVLTLVKTAAPQSISTVGELVHYSFLVTNDGNVTLTAVGVTDSLTPPAGPAISVVCPATTLAPHTDMTCTAEYPVTQADLDNGRIDNSATATATDPTNKQITAGATAEVTVDQQPKLTLEKKADPSGAGAAGDAVSYTFTVTNTGNVTVHSLSVTDTVAAPGTPVATVVCPKTQLAPNESTVCTADYRISQPDADHGRVDNTAVAQAVSPAGATVSSPSASAVVTIPPAPVLTVTKKADRAGVDQAGQLITFTVTVTNGGNVTLSGLTIADTLAAPAGPAISPVCDLDTLAPGESTECTAAYPVTQADIDNGVVTNRASARANTPAGVGVDSNIAKVDVPAQQHPGIAVAKSADVEKVNAAGDRIQYTFEVRNTGNVTLTDISITDELAAPAGPALSVTCPASTLAPGEQSIVCVADYVATQADIDNGAIQNTATATGIPPSGEPMTSEQSSAVVQAPAAPGLTIVKSADPDQVSTLDTPITYSFEVRNTGNVTIDGLTVTDVFTPARDSEAVSCPQTSLAPGQRTTCTMGYRVTQADLDQGSIVNSATASGRVPGGDPVSSEPDQHTVAVLQHPGLTLTKSPDQETVDGAGSTVRYRFSVTNTGNVTIHGIAVTDLPKAPAGPAPMVSCPAPQTVAPGSTMICTADYRVTQADADHGEIVNTATVSGLDPAGGQVTSEPAGATVTVPARPGLSVVKSASADRVRQGETVEYRFVVSNTGNVTLTGVSVADAFVAPAGPGSQVVCPDGVLAPGQSLTCRSGYRVSAADEAAGRIVNTASAAAKDPNGTEVKAGSNTVTVAVNPTPTSSTTVVPTTAPPTTSRPLPNTGFAAGNWTGISAILLGLGLSMLLLTRRRRGSH